MARQRIKCLFLLWLHVNSKWFVCESVFPKLLSQSILLKNPKFPPCVISPKLKKIALFVNGSQLMSFSLFPLCPAGTSAGNDVNGDLDGQTHCQSLDPWDVELTMDQWVQRNNRNNVTDNMHSLEQMLAWCEKTKRQKRIKARVWFSQPVCCLRQGCHPPGCYGKKNDPQKGLIRLKWEAEV